MRLDVRVYGRPAPQGSHETGANGHVMHSSKFLDPWRDKVNFAVRRAYLDRGVDPAAMPLIAAPAPVYLQITHYVLDEQCRAAGSDEPTGSPDADKLLRATIDGIGMARAFTNDSQVVRVMTSKVRGPESGAEIIISDAPIGADEQGYEIMTMVPEYRITLERVGEDDDGDRTWENIVEATGSGDEVADIWLPAIARKLGLPLVADLSGLEVIPGVDVPDAEADVPATQPEPPKRKRRTKAEIEADRIAANAAPLPVGAQPEAGHQAEPEATTLPAPADPPAPFNPFVTG